MAQRKALELGRDIAVGGTLCTVGDGAAQYAFTDTFEVPRLKNTMTAVAAVGQGQT